MTSKMEQDRRVQVDFNAVRANGTIIASSRFASVIPKAGEVVVLYDPDRNECLAIVEKIEGMAITCRPEWRSWRPPVELEYPKQVATSVYAGIAA
jgi:hypothetical protein